MSHASICQCNECATARRAGPVYGGVLAVRDVAADAHELLRAGALKCEPRGPVTHEPGVQLEADYANLGDLLPGCRIVSAVIIHDGATHALKVIDDDRRQRVVWWDRNALRWAFSYIGVYE